MRNSRGQFFGIYLVALTLVMCGVVIGLFYVEQGNALNSLVSPRAVLDVRDDLEIFEMREMVLINRSVAEAKKTFGFCDEGFVDKFDEIFIEEVLEDSDMQEFIFENLTFGDISVEDSARSGGEDFFRNILYSKKLSDCDGDFRTFSRERVGKFIHLKGLSKKDINFPVDFSFEFDQKYSINENGEVTKV